MKIKCKIITPLLMHGVDGKTPEIRAQSIKGVMRFWWRAIHGNLSLDELKKREAEIFGDKERKSSFNIKLLNNDLETDDFNPLPHKLKNAKPLFTIEGFKPNQVFEIEFFGKNIETVKNIFLLSTVLGGFGQRSRRGFGSIEIIETDSNSCSFKYTKENVVNLIKKINLEFSFDDKNFKSKRKYPYIKSIDDSKKEYDDYNKLLKQIAKATHNNKCGKILFKDRMASPIFVSIIHLFSISDNYIYKPIITTLNCRGKLKDNISYKEFLKKSNNFKKAIL